MRAIQILLAASLLVGISAVGQESARTSSVAPTEPAINLADEPHHTLVLQNEAVRVFRVRLQPNEATARHRHKHFYAYFSLRPAKLANEVRGRTPVVTELNADEIRTARGGFNIAERNESSEALELIVVERLKEGGADFATPVGGFRYHDAAVGELFESPGVRAYTMTIAAKGRTELHDEPYDRLIIAVSDLQFRESIDGDKPANFDLKSGEVKWLPRGVKHGTENVGTNPATFITFEFN